MKAKFTTTLMQQKNSHLLFKPVLAFFIFLLVKTEAYSQNAVNTVIDPVTVQVNDIFTVNVRVDFGTGSVGLVETYINFNPLDLEVQSTPTVPAATSAGLPIETVPFSTVASMNATGQIDYGRSTFAPLASHLNADFIFFTITFKALRVPPGNTSTLTFNIIPTRETQAREFNQFANFATPINGVITINAIGCSTPTSTISAVPSCDAKAFNLILASSSAGVAPFDLTITSPTGTATYNNIAVGGVITNFAPPTARIWPAAPAPMPPTSEDNPITAGVRFQSSVTGFVKGVRFFSPDEVPVAPGNFTGQLWTAGGILLASGTFTGVVVDNWNELLFAEPILITANTTYVASYHTSALKYVGTANGLAAPVINGPLTALANGIFSYGGAVTFPVTSTATNYWADVIFSANNYVFNLTGVKDALECTNTGALQTLNVTSPDCGTLPVSLINFSATPKDNSILLRWSTASEFNNLGFELQRSIDGNNGWSAIAFVNGAGNSNSTLNYSYVDENLSASRYYYRLKQIDIDLRFAYSPIVSAVLDGKEAFELEQNYPNPYRGETIIRFTIAQKTSVNLSIFDMNGRLVKVLVNGSKDSGTHAVTLHSGVLTSGLYYYKLQAGDFSAVKKMTVQ
ncbi:MAG: DUF4082 domain-containing protein [Chitinophagaceae bacterium]